MSVESAAVSIAVLEATLSIPDEKEEYPVSVQIKFAKREYHTRQLDACEHEGVVQFDERSPVIMGPISEPLKIRLLAGRKRIAQLDLDVGEIAAGAEPTWYTLDSLHDALSENSRVRVQIEVEMGKTIASGKLLTRRLGRAMHLTSTQMVNIAVRRSSTGEDDLFDDVSQHGGATSDTELDALMSGQEEDDSEAMASAVEEFLQQQPDRQNETKSTSVKQPVRGTYRVFIRIIEAKNLAPQDGSHEVDGVVNVTLQRGLGGTNESAPLHEFISTIAEHSSSPTWNEDYSVELKDLTPDEFAEVSLNFRVFNSETNLLRSIDERLVGLHSFDLLDIYQMHEHALLYQWVGLTLRPGDSVLTGYLRVSVVVIGPEDASEDFDISVFDDKDYQEIGETSDIEQKKPTKKLELLRKRSEKILLPPAVQRSRQLFFLQLNVFFGDLELDPLPYIDSSTGSLQQPSQSARKDWLSSTRFFLTVSFAGHEVSTSAVHAAKPTQSVVGQNVNSASPRQVVFNEQLWLPVFLSKMRQLERVQARGLSRKNSDLESVENDSVVVDRPIFLRLWIQDKTGAAVRVATTELSFRTILRKSLHPEAHHRRDTDSVHSSFSGTSSWLRGKRNEQRRNSERTVSNPHEHWLAIYGSPSMQDGVGLFRSRIGIPTAASEMLLVMLCLPLMEIDTMAMRKTSRLQHIVASVDDAIYIEMLPKRRKNELFRKRQLLRQVLHGAVKTLESVSGVEILEEQTLRRCLKIRPVLGSSIPTSLPVKVMIWTLGIFELPAIRSGILQKLSLERNRPSLVFEVSVGEDRVLSSSQPIDQGGGYALFGEPLALETKVSANIIRFVAAWQQHCRQENNRRHRAYKDLERKTYERAFQAALKASDASQRRDVRETHAKQAALGEVQNLALQQRESEQLSAERDSELLRAAADYHGAGVDHAPDVLIRILLCNSESTSNVCCSYVRLSLLDLLLKTANDSNFNVLGDVKEERKTKPSEVSASRADAEEPQTLQHLSNGTHFLKRFETTTIVEEDASPLTDDQSQWVHSPKSSVAKNAHTLIQQGASLPSNAGKASWIGLGIDPLGGARMDSLKNVHNYAGYLLAQAGAVEMAAEARLDSRWWGTDAEERLRSLGTNMERFHLKLHVYRAEDLPSADQDGMLDAFVVCKWGGQRRASRTAFNSTHPGWFETLTLDVEFPAYRGRLSSMLHGCLLPPLHVELWDYDGPLSRSDFVGALSIPLGGDEFPANRVEAQSNKVCGGSKIERKWHEVACAFSHRKARGRGLKPRGKITGLNPRLLLGIELLRIMPGGTPPPTQPIRPATIPATVEAYILGLRGLCPMDIRKPNKPYVQLHASDNAFDNIEHTGERERRGDDNSVVLRTSSSKTPTARDPNIYETLRLGVGVPVGDLELAPYLHLRVHDRMVGLGGVRLHRCLGSAVISLREILERSIYEGWIASDSERDQGSNADFVMRQQQRQQRRQRRRRRLRAQKRSLKTRMTPEREEEELMKLWKRHEPLTQPYWLLGRSSFEHELEESSRFVEGSKNMALCSVPLFVGSMAADKYKRAGWCKLVIKVTFEQNPSAMLLSKLQRLTERTVSNATLRKIKYEGTELWRRHTERASLVFDRALQQIGDSLSLGSDQGAKRAGAVIRIYVLRAFGVGAMAKQMKISHKGWRNMDNYKRITAIESLRQVQWFARKWSQTVDAGGGGVIGMVERKRRQYVQSFIKNTGTYVRVALEGAHSATKIFHLDHTSEHQVMKADSMRVPEQWSRGENLSPYFFASFELPVSFPGASQLRIGVYRPNLHGLKDELLGETIIDLEERWFHPSGPGQSIAFRPSSLTLTSPIDRDENFHDEDHSKNGFLWGRGVRGVPVELRTLRAPSMRVEKGKIETMLEFLTLDEAMTTPPIAVQPPPPIDVEIRVIVWKSTGLTETEAGSDIFFQSSFGSGDIAREFQRTDTHWFATKGKASFNYRLKFKGVTLPLMRSRSKLKFQAWDKDIVTRNSIIGEGEVDLFVPLFKAYNILTERMCQEKLEDMNLLKENMFEEDPHSQTNGHTESATAVHDEAVAAESSKNPLGAPMKNVDELEVHRIQLFPDDELEDESSLSEEPEIVLSGSDGDGMDGNNNGESPCNSDISEQDTSDESTANDGLNGRRYVRFGGSSATRVSQAATELPSNSRENDMNMSDAGADDSSVTSHGSGGGLSRWFQSRQNSNEVSMNKAEGGDGSTAVLESQRKPHHRVSPAESLYSISERLPNTELLPEYDYKGGDECSYDDAHTNDNDRDLHRPLLGAGDISFGDSTYVTGSGAGLDVIGKSRPRASGRLSLAQKRVNHRQQGKFVPKKGGVVGLRHKNRAMKIQENVGKHITYKAKRTVEVAVSRKAVVSAKVRNLLKTGREGKTKEDIKARQASMDAAQSEYLEALPSWMKTFFGVRKVRPPHSVEVPIYRMADRAENEDDIVQTKIGSVFISVEVVRADYAKGPLRNGQGRSNPNEFPKLPPPHRESLFALLRRLTINCLGPRCICLTLLILLFALYIAIMLWVAPPVMEFVDFGLGFPEPYGYIFLGVCALPVVLCCCCCCYYFCRCCSFCKRRVCWCCFDDELDKTIPRYNAESDADYRRRRNAEYERREQGCLCCKYILRVCYTRSGGKGVCSGRMRAPPARN